LTSTGAGHVLIAMAGYGSLSSITVSGVTAGACSASWVHCPSCHGNDASSGKQVDGWYCLNSASGITNITFTLSATQSGGPSWNAYVFELSSTTTFVIDSTNSVDDSTTCTVCAGVTLTLTGSNDAIMQVYGAGSSAPSSISSPYVFQNAGSGTSSNASLINSGSGTAPNWTSSVTGKGAGGAIAIKENAAVTCHNALSLLGAGCA